MFNLTLFGAGRIGSIHAACVNNHQDVTIKYVVDVHQPSAQKLADQLQATVVDEATALADPAIDGVIIASSTDTHARLILAAARAGKQIFCEKPVDLSVAQVESCLSAIDEYGVQCAIGFNRRFDPRFAELKAALDAGRIGSLEMLTITSRDPSPPPVEYIKVSGGLFKDMMIHDFDMARWLLGEEPVLVSAMASCQVDPAIAEAGDVDTAVVTLQTASGRLCQISNSRRAVYGYDQRIEAFGAEGMLQVNNVGETALVATLADGENHGRPQDFFLERYARAYELELDNFIQCLRGEAQPLSDARDGLRALELAEAALASYRNGQAVAV